MSWEKPINALKSTGVAAISLQDLKDQAGTYFRW